MKTLTLTLILMLTTLVGYAGDSSVVILKPLPFTTNKITLNLPLATSKHARYDSEGFHYGHGMMIGGAAMLLAGYSTRMNYVGFNGPQVQGFFEQPSRAAAIITGAAILFSGIIVTIVI